jgi:hypothetical protein
MWRPLQARAAILVGVTDPVEIFEAAVDALNRTDLDAIADVVDPQIAFIPLRAAVTGAYIGHKGIEEFVAENAQRFAIFHAEFDELRPLRDGRLLAFGYIRMRGRGDSEDTRYKTAGIATFRDGRLASWKDYGNEKAALEAAGVS